MRYRKRPIIIEAVRVRDALRCAGVAWDDLPDWLVAAYDAGVVLFLSGAIKIRTLEGAMRGERDDWVIRGVQGELYPCKPDIFEATYERVD